MVEQNRLVSLFDFENREAIFPGVHRSYKFCLLTLSGSSNGNKQAKFGFFLTRVEHLEDKLRIFNLGKEDFLRLNPNTKTCPVFRTRIDAELTTKIYKRVPILINEQTGENPWGVSFMRMFDMSNDSHLFRTRQQLEADGFHLWGNRMKKGKEEWLPLYEAKMIQQYNHRFATFEDANNRTETKYLSVDDLANPSITNHPWYYLKATDVQTKLENTTSEFLFGYRDIARSTDERTSIYSALPIAATTGINLVFLKVDTQLKILFLCIWNSIVFDYIVRQKLGGTHLSQNYTKQFPIIKPENAKSNILDAIILRSLELIYTSWDLKPLADAIWCEIEHKEKIYSKYHSNQRRNSSTSIKIQKPKWTQGNENEFPLHPFIWSESRRANLQAEIDAIIANLYGLNIEELKYILDPNDIYGENFPGESFRVLKEKEIRQHGEYRTKRLILEAWDKLQEGILV
jgi:hypothetical protein